MNATPFTIDIPDAALADLQLRLGLTRWPDEVGSAPWADGMPLAVLRKVIGYWQDGFDWRQAERRLNSLPQFKTQIDGRAIHYVHVKGVDADSAPLILTHGWPGSFVEMVQLIPMLTDPSTHGFPGCPSFDVVVPSLPGFGFSDAPTAPGTNSQVVASMWHRLMVSLGYPRYFAQGGDIGSGVSTWLARQHPQAVRALHLNFISGSYLPPLGDDSRPLSADEAAWLKSRDAWAAAEGGYSHVHATKPQTLAYALNDSPVGLAAWMLEKFYGWSDGGEDLLDLFSRFDIDELLTNVCVYWFSGSVASTLRIYKENAANPLRFHAGERIAPPLCYAHFPKEIVTPPREWVARVFDIARWTEMPTGGHFAAVEQPRALARDIHAAFAPFR